MTRKKSTRTMAEAITAAPAPETGGPRELIQNWAHGWVDVFRTPTPDHDTPRTASRETAPAR